MDVTRAESHDPVSPLQTVAHHSMQGGQIGMRKHLARLSPILDRFDDGFTRDSRYRSLTGRVNIGHPELIHLVERPSELIAQQLSAGVTVRLK